MAKYIGTNEGDYYRGTDDADLIKGAGGGDRLFGEGGIDRIYGGLDFDELHGGDARDYLYGEGDDDELYGDAGNDIIYGGDGGDYAWGGADADYISGGTGDDVLRGETGNDTLIGGVGDDFMRGGAGVDKLDGGDGYDTASFLDAGATQGVVIDLRTGIVSNDGFGIRETVTSIEAVLGTVHADTMLGTDTANTFHGSTGDTIRGFGGTDVFNIDSVEGATLDGGSGVNSFNLTGRIDTFGPDGKTINTYADQGMSIDLSAQRVLNDGFGHSAAILGFRNATTGDGDDVMVGSAAANSLISGYGNDRLSGGAGDDYLTGGVGADTLTGGAGKDVFGFGTFNEYFGVGSDFGDTITDFTSGQDKLDVRPQLNPLTFIGTEEFGDRTMAIRYHIDGGNTIIEVRDHEPGGWFDLTITLTGVHQLTTDDFVSLRNQTAPVDFAPGPHAFHPALHGDLASLALA